jgi:hypothetical protein
MFRAKPLICIVALVLLATACSSSSSSSTTQPAKQTPIVPTTLSVRVLEIAKSNAKLIIERAFREIDINTYLNSADTPASALSKLSVYRERINDIVVDEVNVSEYGYNISMNSVRDYLSELVQLLDKYLDDIVYSNQDAVVVSGGALSYHLDKFEALEKCYMKLREDC